MKKKDSALTKAKIMKAAEQLFAERGFDAATVDLIAERAGVNKALIYYYFKSKDDILDGLFTSAMKDVMELIEHTYEDFNLDNEEVEQIFNLFIDLISKKKRIIKVIMMESMKGTTTRSPLFKIADYFIGSEVDTLLALLKKSGHPLPKQFQKRQMMVTEFFTMIMPLICFVVYEEECAKHFDIKKDKLKAYFIKAMRLTHVSYHMDALSTITGAKAG